MMLRGLVALLVIAPLAGCMESMPGMGSEESHLMMMEHMKQHWPTVRIDGLDGARVSMRRGVFGEGLDVKAPFQGDFQPTGQHVLSGYPLEIDLDEATSRRFGSVAPIRLRASLMVPEHSRRHGILRIDVTDCALRALVAGDLDVLKVKSEELPTADIACAPPKPPMEEPKKECCGCQNKGLIPGILSSVFGDMSGKGMGDHFGMGSRDKDAAVIEIVMLRSSDRPWR